MNDCSTTLLEEFTTGWVQCSCLFSVPGPPLEESSSAHYKSAIKVKSDLENIQTKMLV